MIELPGSHCKDGHYGGERHHPADTVSPHRVVVGAVIRRCVIHQREQQYDLRADTTQADDASDSLVTTIEHALWCYITIMANHLHDCILFNPILPLPMTKKFKLRRS